jgi:hypothetical protein
VTHGTERGPERDTRMHPDPRQRHGGSSAGERTVIPMHRDRTGHRRQKLKQKFPTSHHLTN